MNREEALVNPGQPGRISAAVACLPHAPPCYRKGGGCAGPLRPAPRLLLRLPPSANLQHGRRIHVNGSYCNFTVRDFQQYLHFQSGQSSENHARWNQISAPPSGGCPEPRLGPDGQALARGGEPDGPLRKTSGVRCATKQASHPWPEVANSEEIENGKKEKSARLAELLAKLR